MDIPALSIAMSQVNLSNQIGVAVLSKNMETAETLGEGLTKMMETSVNPHIGQHIDYSV